jgi:tripartite-type tricarboxylate transporter receptor subunit TctC
MWRGAATGLSFAMCLASPLQASESPRSAPDVERFYEHRTLTLLVATGPGGRYDLSARLVAARLGAFLPGHPDVVVQNAPGAGGLLLANELAHTVPRDGSEIALLQRATPLVAFQGDPNAKFDPLTLTWIGSLSTSANDADLLIVNSSFPAKSAQDLQGTQPRAKIGADMPGATNLIFGSIARDTLGLNLELVRGYPGAPALFVAMENKEIDGQVVLYSSIRAAQPTLWQSGALRPLVEFGRMSRLPALPNVPTARELAAGKPEAIALLDFAELPFFMALPFVAPPGLPPDRAAALREAFQRLMEDPNFVADVKRSKLEYSPISAEHIEELLHKAAATPKSVIAEYDRIFPPH